MNSRNGQHERSTLLEAFDNTSEQRWLQFGGGRLLRAWFAARALEWESNLRSGSPIIFRKQVNRFEIHSVFRLERSTRRGLGKMRHVMMRFLVSPRGNQAEPLHIGVHRETQPCRLEHECIDKKRNPAALHMTLRTRAN